MQNELDKLYLEYLDKILSDNEILKEIEENKLSSPQFVDVSTPETKYLTSDFRIVLVGKETFGWVNPKEREEAGLSNINGKNRKYLEELKRIYKAHNLGHRDGSTYNSPIFQFIDLLYNIIVQKRNVPGMILTELLRHDYEQSTMPDVLSDKTMYDNNYILRKELEILNPNAILFLTGPSYDKYIKHTYPDVVFKDINDFNKNEFALLEGIPNIEKAFRIYHPGYINRLGRDYKTNLVEQIIKHIY